MHEYYRQKRYTRDFDDWPPYHPRHYTPLTIIHHEGRCTEYEFNTVAQELSSNRIIENREAYIDYSRTIKNIGDLFDPYETPNPDPYKILIEGAPGVGKTVLSKEIAFKWANRTLLNSKMLLFLLFVRDPDVKSITSVKSLVYYFCQSDNLGSNIAEWLVKTHGQYLIIVIDGYDEISEEDRSRFKHLIDRKWLPKCGLVITSRPTASSHLHYIVDCRAEVLGFTEGDRKDFIKSALLDQTNKIEELEIYLQSNPFLNSLCYIPLIMSILLCLTEDGISTLPKSQTKLFENFIMMTIVHFLKKDKKVTEPFKASFTDLPQPYNQVFKELSQFAFLTLQKDQLVFTLAEVKATYPNLTPANWYGLGLLKRAQYFKPQDSCDHESFHFIHFSIQEYMAAHHIASLPEEVQFELLKDTFWNVRYCNSWVMYVGITNGENFVFNHFLTGNYFQWSSWLFGTPSISNAILNDKIKCLQLLHCLAETDHEMLSSVESIFHGGVINLSHQSLSTKDIRTLAILLLRSPNKKWEKINLSHCNIDDEICNALCEMFHTQSVALNVKTVDISCNHFHWESLSKLCGVLKCWDTQEVVISIGAFYNNETVKLINDFTKALNANRKQNYLQSGMLLVTGVPEQNRVIIVHSFSKRMCCYQFGGQFKDKRVIDSIKRCMTTDPCGDVNVSYVVPSTGQSLLLDNFTLVKIVGFNLHSKAVHLLSQASNIRYIHNMSSPHQYVADYLTAVICHTYQSNKSYLKTLSTERAKMVKDNLRCLTSTLAFTILHIDIGSEAADDIAFVLSCNTRLQLLSVSGNNLRLPGAVRIARALRHTKSLIELDIANGSIGKEADEIATVLSNNSLLQILRIRNNNLKTEGAIKIAKGLNYATSLTEFNISNNNIGSEAAKYIAAVLCKLTKLQHFCISDNNLKTLGGILIAKGLQNTSSLRILNISNNNIGSEAADDIATVLFYNTELKLVQLSGNDLKSTGASTIAKALCSISSLVVLQISKNNICNEAADDIAAILRCNSGIEHFKVDGNNLENTGAIKITAAIQNATILQVFSVSIRKVCGYQAGEIRVDLLYNSLSIFGDGIDFVRSSHYSSPQNSSGNSIGDDIADDTRIVLSQVQMCRLFQVNFQTPTVLKFVRVFVLNTTSLTELHISNSIIDIEAANCIAIVLHNNIKLQKLYIHQNNLETLGAIEIAKALQYLTSLKEFNISNNNIGSEAADDIAAILFYNTTLQGFNICGNNLESTGTIKIVRALQYISSLTVCDISNNNISSEAADDIAAILQYKTGIKQLVIENNNFTVVSAIKIVRALRNAKFLTYFFISVANTDDGGTNYIRVTLHDNSLLIRGDGFYNARASHCTSSQIVSNCNIESEAANDMAIVLAKVKSCHLDKLYLENTVVLTLVRVLLHNASSLTEVCISNSNIGSKAADDISIVLSCNANLENLKIHQNIIETPSMMKIAKGLRSIASLTSFDMLSNNIGSEAAGDIASIVSNHVNLQILHICANNLGTSGAIKITNALQNVTSLTELDISNNNIGNEAADDIAAVLYHNTGIKRFVGDDNNFNTEGVVSIIRALHHNKFLMYFSILITNIDNEGTGNIRITLHNTSLLIHGDDSYNSRASLYASSQVDSNYNIDSKAANDMAMVLAKVKSCLVKRINFEKKAVLNVVRVLIHNISSLTEFNIANSNIGSKAADEIAGILFQNIKIQKFSIQGRNIIEMVNIKQITKSLQNPNISSLTKFAFSGFRINRFVVEDITAILSHNTKLEILKICNTINLEMSGFKISRALQNISNISSLTELNISNNNVGSEAANDITAVLYNNPTLQKLYIHGNNLETSGAIKISRALQCISTLTVCNISNNNIGDEAADYIAAILHCNNNIKIFLIDDNNFNEANAIKIIGGLCNTNFILFSVSVMKFNGKEIGSNIRVILNEDLLLIHGDKFGKAKASHCTSSQIVSDYNIESETAEDMAIVLAKVKRCHLGRIDLENSIVLNFVRTLMHNTLAMTEFQVSDSNIGNEAVDDIATALSSSTQLQKLIMQDNAIEILNTLKIIESLQNISSLTRLDISSSNIDSDTADNIAAVLSHNTKLQMLNIYKSNLGTPGTIKIVQSLQNASSLTEFNISNNNIGSEAADDIVAVLSNFKLQKIYIHGNNLETSGAIKIARGLNSVSSFTEFNISNNNIGSEAAGDIAAVLSHNTKLQIICVDGNNLDTSGAIEIARGLNNISSLIEFGISNNNIGCEAADDIAAVLSHNTKLQTFHINQNNLQASSIIKIIRALQHASSLSDFDFSNNNIASEAVNEITSALIHNTKLQIFQIDVNKLKAPGEFKFIRDSQNTPGFDVLNTIGSGDVADDCYILMTEVVRFSLQTLTISLPESIDQSLRSHISECMHCLSPKGYKETA